MGECQGPPPLWLDYPDHLGQDLQPRPTAGVAEGVWHLLHALPNFELFSFRKVWTIKVYSLAKSETGQYKGIFIFIF